MRRAMALLGLGALLVATATGSGGSAAAQGADDGVTRAEIDAADPLTAFGDLGFNEDAQRYFRVITHDTAGAQEYRFADRVDDNPPTLDVPGTRLVGIGATVIGFPDITLPGETTVGDSVFVPNGDHQLGGRPSVIFWAEFDGELDTSAFDRFLNRGFVIPGSDNLGIPAWQSTFPGDTWNGGFRMPTLTYGPDPWDLTVFEFQPPQTFLDVEMDGFAYLAGNTLIIAIDSEQLFRDVPPDTLSPEDFRFGYHGHDHDGRFGAVEDSASFITVFPPQPRTYEDFARADTTLLRAPWQSFPIVEPSQTTTTTAPTTTVQPAPTTSGVAPATTSASTTAGAAPAATAAPPTAGGTDGGFLGWLLLILGIVLIIFGLFWWFFLRAGPQPRRIDVGGTRVRDPKRGGETSAPGLLPPHEREHATCDWSLYFNDGGNRVALRKGSFQSHECCVYDIDVATRVVDHVQAAKARQDDDAERLRIPDYDFGWQWVDLAAHASTRSGPFGRLDWMHGLGDPTEQAALATGEDYWQGGQGEEPPELAVHLAHEERTRIRVRLTAGCPEYDNTYGTYGKSAITVMATHECTNDAPGPACPVELNAFGVVAGEVWGGNAWAWASDASGTDIDELERSADAKRSGDEDARSALNEASPRPLWDGHDHERRDRNTYQADDAGSDAGTVHDDVVTMYVESRVVLHAGQIVPMHVHPTTERVSTHIEGDIDNVATIDGEMVPRNCESNGCHGHGPCSCTPKFSMRVSGTGSWIDVDGNQYPILRIPTSADRRTPPAAAGYRLWELQK